jgi:heme-degrading monooxygenase HmoA
VVARIWRGAVRAEDADAYVAYIEETGLREYRDTPGNRGAWLLRRTVGDRCEIVTLSHWDSLDSIRAFAGDDGSTRSARLQAMMSSARSTTPRTSDS